MMMGEPNAAPRAQWDLVAVAVAIAITGLACLVLTWAETSDRELTVDQVPYVISGGLGGIALMVFGMGLGAIQRRRLQAARRRAEIDRVITAVSGLAAALRGELGG